jgi:hypothetical protein
MQTFDPKKPGEVLNVGFDFSDVLAPAENLVSATISITVLRGTDPAPNDMRKNDPAIIGDIVSQFIQGGIAGVTYLITCTAVTSDPQTLIDEGVMVVESSQQTSALFMKAIDVYAYRQNQLAIAAGSYDQLANLSDDVIWQKMVAAEQDLGRLLGIPLQPTYIFDHQPTGTEITALAGQPYQWEDGYNLPPNFFSVSKFGCFRTRVFPIVEIKSIRLVYPNQLGASFEIPMSWIRVDNKYGIIHIFPSAQSVTAPLSIFMVQALGAGTEIPCMIRVEYVAGISATNGMYNDLVELAKRMATLRILHDSFLSPGDSISVDGLSQSSAANLKDMQQNLDAQVENLRQRLRGVLFDVM